jgi:hypothetical protein
MPPYANSPSPFHGEVSEKFMVLLQKNGGYKIGRGVFEDNPIFRGE